MAEFPKLKTGAVAQYPLNREVRGSVRVLPFVDGTEQRYRSERIRRKWRIELDQLDEGESSILDDFVRTHLETLESFEFTDPWSGITYPRCAVEGDEHELEAWAAGNCRISLVVTEEDS
jgi:hypothetical protein